MPAFPQWKIYVLSIIDNSPILGKMETQNLKVNITLLRPSRWVSFYLGLRVASILDTTGLWHMVNKKYSFFPHSHAILHLLCLWTFCPLESSSCLSFWIFIQAPLSIVSFCVRDVFNLQLTDREELLAILYSRVSILCFDMYCFFLEFLTLNIL